MKSLLGAVLGIVAMSAPVIAQRPTSAACNAEGTPAKLNFIFKDINNRKTALADFKGKVIILDWHQLGGSTAPPGRGVERDTNSD
jgi:cytochrome oxidase Cu insertion factor (SCO1/SenC/PrrC family)